MLRQSQPAGYWGLGGCLVMGIIYILITWLSKFLIGYSLGVWFGAEVFARWDEVNMFIQWAIAFVSASITVPVGIVSFFVQLVVDTPVL